MDYTSGIIAKKSLPNQRSQLLSFRRFIVLDFTLSSVINFKLILVNGSSF